MFDRVDQDKRSLQALAWPRYLALADPIVQWPRTPPFHGGNTGSNPVRVASIVVDGMLAKCITLSHNKCIKICLHSLTYRDEEMHAFRVHVPGPGRSTPVGLRSLARACGMERK